MFELNLKYMMLTDYTPCPDLTDSYTSFAWHSPLSLLGYGFTMNIFSGNALPDIRWYGTGGPYGSQGNVDGDGKLIWAFSNRLLNSHSLQIPPSELHPVDPMFTCMNLNMRNILIDIFRWAISCYLVGENCSFISIPLICVSHSHEDHTVVTLVIVKIWADSVRFLDALSNVLYRLL